MVSGADSPPGLSVVPFSPCAYVTSSLCALRLNKLSSVSSYKELILSCLKPSLMISVLSQSCLTLCDPMDCSPPGFSVHGDSPGKNTGVGCHALLQGEQPRDQTQVSCIVGGFFTVCATREAHEYWSGWPIPSPGDLPNPGIEPGSPASPAL